MKIIYIANASHIGGGNKSLLTMAQKFQEVYTVHVVVPGRGEFCNLLNKAKISYSTLNINFRKTSILSFINTFLNLLKLVRTFSPDIIHVNDLFCYRAPGFIAKFLNIPIICHMRFSVEPRSVRYFLKARPSFIIFNSLYLKNLFLKNNHEFSKINNEVVYNFFDPNEFFAPDIRTQIRQKWGLENYYLVAIIGNFYPVKGHDIFLKAATKLKKYRTMKFLIVGKDLDPHKKNEKRIRRLISTLKLESNVFFLGFKKEIKEVLAGIDVLAVPSIYEPFGRVAVEGLLGALPVVASRTGGLVEIVKDAPCAFLFSNKNSSELASKIYNIYSFRREYPIIENRNYAIKKFGQDNNFEKLKNIYNSLTANR
ncbi:glycosyltransferase family 4 protein [Thermodesulfatator atlanticus]|uniref:glycosyltransferase family 4 protein n=1 Tax=Thermodesulfatator atlanticus TaxID=501497 RepID=UPI0003B5511E|nr:glycosyltransferase family 4 protein [Thermodesulfatator atlanticus]